MEERQLALLKEIGLLEDVNIEYLFTKGFKNNLNIDITDVKGEVEDLIEKNYLELSENNSVSISEKGRNTLKQNYPGIVLIGKVVSGLEQGKYYMSKRGYKKQFRKKLGINPYEGTLNIKLEEDSIDKFKKLKKSSGIHIEGFSTRKEDFGSLTAFSAEVGGIDCALIIPFKSEYERIAELISEVKLRDKLDLKDGDIIQILVKLWE
ncbi:MAG: DUF120 domain-containing protein [Thermoplasmatota archaeon]